MNKYFTTITNTNGDSLPFYRARVLDSGGSVVTIYSDAGGTRFTDSAGDNVNYATANDEGLVEFYWTAASSQTLQFLDTVGNVVKPIADFANNFSVPEAVGNVDAILGVPASDENLGAFDGAIIPDDQAIKTALQALETEVEANETALAGSGGAALVGMADGETVEARLSRYQIPTIAALEALSPNDGDTAYITDGWRAGGFTFYSAASYAAKFPVSSTTAVGDDTEQGIHIAPSSDATGASGVWVRNVRAPANVQWFGASPDATAAVNTVALHAAMKYLLDQYPVDFDYYPGRPTATDSYDVNRQTGTVYFPTGRYDLEDEAFSSLAHTRAPFVGFEFVGDGPLSTVLILETGGVESWFYNNGSGDVAKFQRLSWREMTLRSDDYRFGNMMKMYSIGGPKQMYWNNCEFRYLQKFLHTEGTGNADLTVAENCKGHFYSTVLTLDNPQSVQHDFFGCSMGTYGDYIHDKQNGGGNVNFVGGSIDFVYHDLYSPAGGNALFHADSNANIGIGNNTFKFENIRFEIEAYMSTAGAPLHALYRSDGEAQAKSPRVLFDNCAFVNGLTYTHDGTGTLTGASEFRRIGAAKLYPREHLHLRNCVLLKNFFYEILGVNSTGSPNAGGMIKVEDCFDGTTTQLPSGDSALGNIHDRVTYDASSARAGRMVTIGVREHSGGSPVIRYIGNTDPEANRQFGREESSVVQHTHLKPPNLYFPWGFNATRDFYFNIPANFKARRLYLEMPAGGSSTDAYQLHVGSDDKVTTLYSSTSGQTQDQHLIDIENPDFQGITELRVWATTTTTASRNGGFAYIEHT